MTVKNSWGTIRQKVSRNSHRDLVGLIAELYKLNKANKHFLDARFADTKATLEDYKKIISKALYVYDPFYASPQYVVAKKAIADFKKSLGTIEHLLELEVYYCEILKDLIRQTGCFDDRYIERLRTMLSEVTKQLHKYPEYKTIYKSSILSCADVLNEYGWEDGIFDRREIRAFFAAAV
jgi:hypothetical protein